MLEKLVYAPEVSKIKDEGDLLAVGGGFFLSNFVSSMLDSVGHFPLQLLVV